MRMPRALAKQPGPLLPLFFTLQVASPSPWLSSVPRPPRPTASQPGSAASQNLDCERRPLPPGVLFASALPHKDTRSSVKTRILQSVCHVQCRRERDREKAEIEVEMERWVVRG